MVERVAYDEFSYFHENAEEFGLPYDGPPTVRRESVEVGDRAAGSARSCGARAPPELVLVHGGAQNAHTWDTVAMALGRPLVAIDLPGHGHSDGGISGSLQRAGERHRRGHPRRLAGADARSRWSACRSAASRRSALTDQHPELVRAPGARRRHPRGRRRQGPGHRGLHRRPRDLPELRRAARPHDRVQPDPHRVVAAAGHPPQRRAAGRRQLGVALPPLPRARARSASHPDFTDQWDGRRRRVAVPMMLVRGMRPQSVVDDADEAELLRRQPAARGRARRRTPATACRATPRSSWPPCSKGSRSPPGSVT